MNSITQINLFKTLFFVFLISAIIFLVLSIVLFFAFKIPQVYMMRTGRAQKRTIEEMKKINSETGRLENSTPNGKKGMSQIFGNSAQLDAMSKTAVLYDYNVAGTMPPTPAAPVQEALPSAETTILSNDTQQQSHQPTVDKTSGETTVLSNMDFGTEQKEERTEKSIEPDTSFGRFEITRQMIEIHSDEIIA